MQSYREKETRRQTPYFSIFITAIFCISDIYITIHIVYLYRVCIAVFCPFPLCACRSSNGRTWMGFGAKIPPCHKNPVTHIKFMYNKLNKIKTCITCTTLHATMEQLSQWWQYAWQCNMVHCHAHIILFTGAAFRVKKSNAPSFEYLCEQSECVRRGCC